MHRGQTNRRDGRSLGDSNVSDNEWPVVTLSFYQSILKEEKLSAPETLNQGIVALCRAQIELGHAILHTQRALVEWRRRDNDKLVDKLSAALNDLREIRLTFPLDVRNK